MILYGSKCQNNWKQINQTAPKSPNFTKIPMAAMAPGSLLGSCHGLVTQPWGLAFQFLQRLLRHHVGCQVMAQATLQPGGHPQPGDDRWRQVDSGGFRWIPQLMTGWFKNCISFGGVSMSGTGSKAGNFSQYQSLPSHSSLTAGISATAPATNGTACQEKVLRGHGAMSEISHLRFLMGNNHLARKVIQTQDSPSLHHHSKLGLFTSGFHHDWTAEHSMQIGLSRSRDLIRNSKHQNQWTRNSVPHSSSQWQAIPADSPAFKTVLASSAPTFTCGKRNFGPRTRTRGKCGRRGKRKRRLSFIASTVQCGATAVGSCRNIASRTGVFFHANIAWFFRGLNLSPWPMLRFKSSYGCQAICHNLPINLPNFGCGHVTLNKSLASSRYTE